MSTTQRPTSTTEQVVSFSAGRKVLAALRIVVGFNFLWAFLDKTFGLQYSTAAENAWIAGGSPTRGYLMGASEGTFGGLWSALAGNVVVDVLFMMALLGLGIAALLGIGLSIAAGAGMLLSIFFYLSQLPLEAGAATNPVTTSHWYYFLLFLLFPLFDAGRTWGLAGRWERLAIVERLPLLR
jgi:thiosulfate dehydrogenase (quinone) large subunit